MISIVIPTLNEEKQIPFLIESIKKQNFKGIYEVVVADAGSKDRTVEVIKDYGFNVFPCGGSPASGRNAGAKMAKGDALLFLDADMVLSSSGFLTDLLCEFEKRKLDLASFTIYPDGNLVDKFFFGVYNFWVLISQRFLAHATAAVLVRKAIHEKIGGFDESIKIGEDHYYVRCGTRFGKFGFVKTKPVLSSPRRFEEDGRLRTYSKYLLAGVYMLIFGPVRSDVFNYKFGHYSQKKK